MQVTSAGNLKRYVAGVIAIIAIFVALNWDYGRVGRLLYNLSMPHSGEDETIPEEMHFIIYYLRSNAIKEISISELVAGNRFLAQPLTVGVYPVIVKKMANIHILSSDEALPMDCTTLKVEKGFRIADCR